MYLPTVYKPLTGRLRVGIPFARDNRYFLKHFGDPVWEPKGYWTLPRSSFTSLTVALLLRYGKPVRVAIAGAEGTRCDTRCQNARGFDCVCSCGGAFHGSFQDADWIKVGDTTLVRPGLNVTTFSFGEMLLMDTELHRDPSWDMAPAFGQEVSQ